MTPQATLAPTQLATIDGLRLRCPRCAAALEPTDDAMPRFSCVECHFPMASRDGIWHALPIERATYYSRFIKDYEAIRAAEGRGSQDSSYYLNLPVVDRSDSNASQWKIRARTYKSLKHRALSHICDGLQTCPRILDIGAGNGWLSYRLAQ